MWSITHCNELSSACSTGTCGYKSVTARSWGSGERPQQWALSVHFPYIYRGCYTRFNIRGKFHLALPLWPSLTSILSATEMPDCPPYRPLNELSVPLWHGSSSLLLLSTWTQQKLDNEQNWCSFRGSASSALRDVLDLKQPCNPECRSGLSMSTFPVSLLGYTDIWNILGCVCYLSIFSILRVFFFFLFAAEHKVQTPLTFIEWKRLF